MVLKEFPGCGIFFYFKFLFGQIFGVKDEQNFFLRFFKTTIAGGLTGSIAWTIGMPFDVLKSFI